MTSSTASLAKAASPASWAPSGLAQCHGDRGCSSIESPCNQWPNGLIFNVGDPVPKLQFADNVLNGYEASPGIQPGGMSRQCSSGMLPEVGGIALEETCNRGGPRGLG